MVGKADMEEVDTVEAEEAAIASVCQNRRKVAKLETIE